MEESHKQDHESREYTGIKRQWLLRSKDLFTGSSAGNSESSHKNEARKGREIDSS